MYNVNDLTLLSNTYILEMVIQVLPQNSNFSKRPPRSYPRRQMTFLLLPKERPNQSVNSEGARSPPTMG